MSSVEELELEGMVRGVAALVGERIEGCWSSAAATGLPQLGGGEGARVQGLVRPRAAAGVP